MSATIHLNADLRSVSGKGASRRLRREGVVPAIVYGGDRDPAMISVAHNEFLHQLENEAIYTQVIELRVGNKRQDVILRDLQRHPFKNRVLHADFYRIDQNVPIHVVVPLHIINDEQCVGVKQDGGMLTHLVTEVEVLALPKLIPEYIELDALELHLGDTMHMTDIKLPEGVQIVSLMHLDDVEDIEHDPHNVGVLSVVKTRAEEVVEEAAPEEPEAPEVAGEEADDDGDAED